MFHTVLVANRGEIACRIIRTLRSLGIRSVAVYSDADASSRHVSLADVAVRLGPAAASQSYLAIEKVIRAAQDTGAQAIHPGYGFLAENASFARACEDSDIVFIGPTSHAIEVMGDKITAKLAVQERGVPTVPGVARPGLTDEDLLAAADGVGYPLLIKPSAGGGGKGMHVVEDPRDLTGSLAAARREAAAGFGDDTLFLERYLQNPRHIEVQILADEHGSVVHLGERECSLQRRHQKVIEEAPSPLLDEITRARIGEAACETARSVNYRGAGTVEFIVAADQPDEFFFMEMNTRLQVEHPVTEEVTGIDLVEQQLHIAAGEPLIYRQEDIVLTGHSIEARVYAEDPEAGFLPTGGLVDRVHHPRGDGIRVDTALEDGLRVSVDYDPMLAKIIATGANRDDARRRLIAALNDTAVFGFSTNIEFLRLLLEVPEVAAGDLDTGLIARVFDELDFREPTDADATAAALLLDKSFDVAPTVWERRDGWRLGAPRARRYKIRSRTSESEVMLGGSPQSQTVFDDSDENSASVIRSDDGAVVVTVGGTSGRIFASIKPDHVEISRDGAVMSFDVVKGDHSAESDAASNPVLSSPMPGTVVSLHAANGQSVDVDAPVVVVEAMKMEHVVRSTVGGVLALHVAVGDTVARGQVLAEIFTPSTEPVKEQP
jgi:acetyl-CoA/propionyl-CoA carboxylase, biotin carboxylase, biotin carboxyl carrier protein